MAVKKKEITLTNEEKLNAALVPEDEQPYPIPGNWVWTKGENISLLITKGSTPTSYGFTYNNEGINFIKTENIDEYGSIGSFTDFINQETNEFLKRSILRENDILISIAGTIGRIGIVDKTILPANTNQALSIIRCPWLHINNKYLFYYLKSPSLQKYATKSIVGVGRANISLKNIGDSPIPLPPLPEQNRIAEKLESLLGKIKEAKTLLNEIPDILQNFRQSVLAAACSGRLTKDWREENCNVEKASILLKKILKERKIKYDDTCRRAKEEGKKKPKEDYKITILEEEASIPEWTVAKLDNLIYIAGRIGWRGLKADEYTDDGPLFFSVHSLNYGEEVDSRDAFHISMGRYNESPEIQLQENDILLAKDGAGIGKIGIVKNLNQLATVNSSLLVIRSQEAFVPKFLFYFLSGPELQNIAKMRITGSATPHLFQRDIREFSLLIPPLKEQQEIVRCVESLFSKADDIELQYKEAMALIETLPEIILSKAFHGELVPQDPNDEPAIKLLEKILTEKDSLVKEVCSNMASENACNM